MKHEQKKKRDRGQLLTLEAATDLMGQINSTQNAEYGSLARISTHRTNGRTYFQVNHENYSIGRA